MSKLISLVFSFFFLLLCFFMFTGCAHVPVGVPYSAGTANAVLVMPSGGAGPDAGAQEAMRLLEECEQRWSRCEIRTRLRKGYGNGAFTDADAMAVIIATLNVNAPPGAPPATTENVVQGGWAATASLPAGVWMVGYTVQTAPGAHALLLPRHVPDEAARLAKCTAAAASLSRAPAYCWEEPYRSTAEATPVVVPTTR